MDNQSLDRGWVLPPYRDQVRAGVLYLVATPIGNLGDMTVRALDTLASVDVVLCEDTRVSKKLFDAYGIKARCEAYHDHSDAGKRDSIIARLQEGQSFALISDAGMPMISDPGYKLVQDVIEADLSVTSLPGANAPLAALQLSGMPSDAFCFVGFLPQKQGARRSHLERFKDVQASLIAFENASRLSSSLADIRDVLGSERQVAVVREITKKFESVLRGSVDEILTEIDEHGAPKGEIVIVISSPETADFSEDDIQDLLKDALQEHGTKEAAAKVSEITGLSKKELYDLALSLGKEA